MDEEKKKTSLKNRPGLEERIRNTAELLSKFAKENLDEKTAAEIIDDLKDITDGDDGDE